MFLMRHRRIAAFALALTLAGSAAPFMDTVPEMTAFAETSGDIADTIDFTEIGQYTTITIQNTTEVPTWYSDKESVATVDSTGKITAVGNGTAFVYAVFKSQMLKFQVNVNAEIKEDIIVTDLGTIELSNARPSADLTLNNAPEGTPEWSSSDETVASVDQKGTVTAAGSGTCIITAVIGKYKYTVTINSTFVPEDPDAPKTIKIGTVTLTNESPTSSIKSNDGIVLAWKSSDEKVATVDEKGIITAAGKGNCQITAVSGNITYVVEVVSSYDPSAAPTEKILGSMELDNETPSKKINLSNTGDAEVKWSSSDESIAVVDENGVVTAVSSGNCRIIALIGKVNYIMEVTVNYTKPEITSETLEIKGIGKTLQLSAKGADGSAPLEWLSMNTEVLTVDENGLVTSVAEGEAVVLAKFSDYISQVTIKVVSETLYGDANCDGTVDISDAVLIMQSQSNPEKYIITPQGLKNADCVDNPKGVTPTDALAIQMVEAKTLKASQLPTTSEIINSLQK